MANKSIPFNGQSLAIHGRPGDYYFNDLNLGDKTNDFLLYLVNDLIARDSVVLDIGANIGLTAALLSSIAVDGRVLAFEPDPQTFEFLQQTIAANNMHWCTPYQFAFGSQAGTLAFMSDPHDSTGNRLVPDGVALGGSNGEVAVKRLDDFLIELDLSRLDFIKMDVEGFELDVLKGATETLLKFRPKLFLEFNSFTLIAFGNQNPRDLLAFLHSTFPYVYQFHNGHASLMENTEAELQFIHRNLIQHGCVDDLLCSFAPLPGQLT